MIAAAHQPHFLPWLGYLNKVANSDVFIWLDTVQYRKNYFQNRTQIMDADGRAQWLTLPVHARSTSSIGDVTIAERRWADRVERTVLQCYRKAPYFEETWPRLRAAMRTDSVRLADVNFALFTTVLEFLGCDRAGVTHASALNSAVADPTERLVALCRCVGADRYIAGKGGRDYMRLNVFEQAGIEVIWQAFDVHRTAYARPSGASVEGLSVIDSLFHLGPARTAALVRDAWVVPQR